MVTIEFLIGAVMRTATRTVMETVTRRTVMEETVTRRIVVEETVMTKRRRRTVLQQVE